VIVTSDAPPLGARFAREGGRSDLPRSSRAGKPFVNSEDLSVSSVDSVAPFLRSVASRTSDGLSLAWRMAVAKDLLRRRELGIAEVAERIG
jgi:AraC-like DNA-binding protein